MSDTEKPSPESPQGGASEDHATPTAGGANVISIEQARAELLRKPRKGATPPQGLRPRSRGRDVPSPVTLPPGEHAAVIVTDTPAARAHVDKKTVHPGEAPLQTHEKKVRVKTSLDPRRAKTQVSDRRSGNDPDMQATAQDGLPVTSLWSRSSQPPSASVPPPPGPMDSVRPSLARPRPIPRDNGRSAPLFILGVALAAAFGAVVVYLLSRQKSDSPASGDTSAASSITATLPVRSGAPGDSSAARGPAQAPSGTEPGTGTDTLPDGPPAVVTGQSGLPTSKTTHTAPSTKPTSAPTLVPTASAKPTSILPFGKEEP